MKAKRTIAGVMALAMLASTAVSTSVSAADAAVSLKASNETVAAAGDAFAVQVTLEDIPSTKVNVLDFAITYDNTVLTIDKVEIGDAANVDVSGDSTGAEAPVFASSIRDKEVVVSWTTALDSASWIAEDGVILTISGTVNDGVADGTVTPIDFAPATRETYTGTGEYNKSLLVGYVYGTDSAEYTVNTTAGSVTVGTAKTTDTTTTTGGGTTTEATTATSGDQTDDTTKETQATTKSTGDASVLYGDVNCDGRVDITDSVLLNKATAGAVKLNEAAAANADCDSNGELSSNDSIVLLKFLVHLITSLPSAE
ncbi:cohesin domain-containing protein [Ruminococcus sp.]|uniref:cohesin domain-containing protein n=1 Tax=Ruminococcus sp. TaxID=41978 RepID=UPI0025CBB81F|nr:cohesin domain-containing protein [Ruminococcus sp.]